MKNINPYFIYFLCFLTTVAASAQSQISSEDILLVNDSIQLPGTLSYNNTLKKQPLVIFIHGSGNVDRNGNQLGLNANANYIKLLADSLNQNGIAFYRYDKRTSTASNMKFLMKELTFDKFIEDAILAIEKLKENKRFSDITLIGHSQGSLVAMLAAKAGIDKYISLAGPAHSIDRSIVKQVRLQNGDSIASIVESHFKELKSTGTIAKVDPNLMALFSPPNLPFLASWAAYNPSEEIKKVNIPILILNGTKDLQVYKDDANALHEANPKSTLAMIEGMNHVLKTINKDEDNLKSYNSADFPLSIELVKLISEFIKN